MINLICIYNANSGFFNGMMDSAHKAFSPKTYKCELCALTHGLIGMRAEWKRFSEENNIDIQYLHKDEITGKLEFEVFELPVILRRETSGYVLVLNKLQLSDIQNIEDLISKLKSVL